MNRMESAIRVRGVGKRYRIGAAGFERQSLIETVLTRLRQGLGPARSAAHLPSGNEESGWLWALRDISFDVKHGEVLGLVGKNGSGKSTLLKILSAITLPTEGTVELEGRVGSLLEVGTGFHPELTGRENVYLNGAILGLRRGDIQKRFDEIVAFSEVERFLDTPVKHYSSGMYMRLAFAVAAHLEPDILLVDEVLAVGDMHFQRKCLGKVDLVAREGRTVVFVSHNMSAVKKLCHRVVYLEDGRVQASGETESVIAQYAGEAEPPRAEYVIAVMPEPEAPGRATLLTVEDKTGRPAATLPVGQPWQVRVRFSIARSVDHFMIALGMRTGDDVPLRTSWSRPVNIQPGVYEAVFRDATIILGVGRYPLIVGLSSFERSFHYIEQAGVLTIADYAEGVDLVRIAGVGAILNPLEITVQQVA